MNNELMNEQRNEQKTSNQVNRLINKRTRRAKTANPKYTSLKAWCPQMFVNFFLSWHHFEVYAPNFLVPTNVNVLK